MPRENRSGSILLMEDEELVSTIAIQMLDFIGYEAVLAKSGGEAVDLYQQRFLTNSPFTAVLMDLSVPAGMGGAEAVREVLKIDPGAKVIVSSGQTHDPAMINYEEYGFSAAIAKPYNLQGLTHVLKGMNS